MKINLYYSQSKKSYFFHLQDQIPSCHKCKKEITNTLIYHTVWSKSYDKVLLYCLNCIKRVSLRGYEDELKYCVISHRLPEDALPVFERRPSLVNKRGLNTFQVGEITKNSEAEIIDRTIISKDQNQSIMDNVQKNLIEFKKRDEELGYSAFLLQDMTRDEFKQLGEENKENSLENAATKILSKDKSRTTQKLKREKAYKEEIPNVGVDREKFFEVLKESVILLPNEDKRLIGKSG